MTLSLFEMQRPAVEPILVNEKVMAVDFGINGGFVWNDHDTLCWKVMPELAWIASLIKREAPRVLVGENVHPFPNQGAVSAATFGRGVGQIEGICAAHGVKMVFIQPEEWVRWYEIGKRSDFKRKSKGRIVNDVTAWKKHLQAHAQKLFPNLSIHLHIADAVLIWNYYNNPERIKRINPPTFR